MVLLFENEFLVTVILWNSDGLVSITKFFKNFVVDSKGLFKCLGEATKNSNKVFSSNQILYTHKNIIFLNNFFIFQRLVKAIKYSKIFYFKKEFS